MFIKKHIYINIVEGCPTVPPEIGGIIGGSGETVSHLWMDHTCDFRESAQYIPNLGEINRRIRNWERKGIQLLGIFHSHLDGQNILSHADREYIIKIMLAMPAKTQYMFFPIVIPKQGIYAFKAIRKAHEIFILSDVVNQV